MYYRPATELDDLPDRKAFLVARKARAVNALCCLVFARHISQLEGMKWDGFVAGKREL
jgi:hypothetical protein